MGAWWNSLEKVSNLNTYVLGFAALFGFLAAVLIIAGWLLGNRVSDLQQAQLARNRTDADTRIAAANQIAAQANEHAKQLEEQTEELRSQNLEIHRRISPRFLTTADEQTLFEGIKSFRGHQIIVDRLGDGEAGPYGDNIVAVLKKAGWVVQINSIGSYSPPTYGIVCHISSNPDEGAKALIAAFKNAKIELTLMTIPAASQDSWMELFIGLKPVN